MTRRAFLSVTVLIIYNMSAGEKLISTRSRPACPKNIIFAHFQKTYENPMDFKHFCFRPNSPRELSLYFCSTYMRFWFVRRSFCRTSALVLTFFVGRLHLHIFINREVRTKAIVLIQFSLLIKNMLLAPVSLIILSKPMVRLQCRCSCRCSCKMYGTSAVPLLVQNVQYVCGAVARNRWNIINSQLNKHRFS